MTKNKTSCLLLPLLLSKLVSKDTKVYDLEWQNIKNSIIQNENFDNLYVGNILYTKSPNMYKYLYLVFKGAIPTDLESIFMNSKYYRECRKYKDDYVYIFINNENEIREIVFPFIKGKYTKISREYVEKYFPVLPFEKPSINRMVLDGSQFLREKLGERIGVTLPDNAEVHSVPSKADEVYGYLR